MKSVYWRPKKCSPTTTLLVGLVAIAVLTCVELLPRWRSSDIRDEQLAANQLASLCRDQIRLARASRGLTINHAFDPTRCGMLGKTMTLLTSKPGNLEAKQLTMHPQFPAAAVQMFRDAGVQEGETIAVSWTGSFPAFNVAVASAIEAMQLRPIVISSVCASQYGANEPEFTWLDMETALQEAGLLRLKTVVATIGGPLDHGAGMDAESLSAARHAAERNEVRMLKSKRLSGLIDARMRVIDRKAAGERIAAFVNVGGGIASSGGSDSQFRSGLTMTLPKVDAMTPDCMMQRFSTRGVPVLNFAAPNALAKKLGLSSASETWAESSLPRQPTRASTRFAAGSAFLGICVLLTGFVLKDAGNKWLHRLVAGFRGEVPVRAVGQAEGPQLMV